MNLKTKEKKYPEGIERVFTAKLLGWFWIGKVVVKGVEFWLQIMEGPLEELIAKVRITTEHYLKGQSEFRKHSFRDMQKIFLKRKVNESEAIDLNELIGKNCKIKIIKMNGKIICLDCYPI